MATQADFSLRLRLLAKVCDFQLSSDLVALYDRALRRFGYDAAVTAIEAAVIERRGNERMPSIGDLVHRCAPQLLEQDTAVEVSGRIVSAVSKFGYANEADAASWVGEIGWRVITENNGGWQNLCQNMREKDVTTWRAQLRDQAAAAIRRHKAGILNTAPKFGEVASAQRMTALVGDVLKKSEDYDDKTRNTRAVPQEPERRQLDAQGHS